MLTYPMSTLHVLRILMHLSLDHVTLPPGEFHNPHISPPIGLEAAGRTRVGLSPKFLVS